MIRSGHHQVCILAATIVLFCGCASPGKPASEPAFSAPEPCVDVAPRIPSDPISPARWDKKLYAPMSKADIEPLVQALRRIERKGMSGHMSEIGQRPGPMSVERVNVLLHDVTAALTRIHLQEALGHMGAGPNPDPFFMEWGSGVAGFLDACGEMRYAEFGGLPTLEGVNILVEDNRDILEPLLFEVFDPSLPPVPDGRPVP